MTSKRKKKESNLKHIDVKIMACLALDSVTFFYCLSIFRNMMMFFCQDRSFSLLEKSCSVIQ